MAEDISSYRDLRVWQDATMLVENCYTLTRRFPREEMFGLTSQIRRAAASIPANAASIPANAASIPANIAEGYGRENSGSYIQFPRIAQGSLKELETHLLISQRVKLAASSVIEPMLEQCGSLGRMLRMLIRSIEEKKW